MVLRRYLRAIGQYNGSWYVEDFEVAEADGKSARLLKNCSWADWQSNGDLLFATDGQLFRLPSVEADKASPDDPLSGARLVADLRALRFRNVAAPDWATRWP